jgi:hypothetical protein
MEVVITKMEHHICMVFEEFMRRFNVQGKGKECFVKTQKCSNSLVKRSEMKPNKMTEKLKQIFENIKNEYVGRDMCV